MIKYQWYVSGQLFGIIYEMPAGRKLPMHEHETDHLHNVTVLKGAVVFDSKEKYVILDAGQVLDFDGTKPHEITALGEGATLLNLFINGMPESYRALPVSEHSGSF
jgi:quercetin dioxygenase-like cupin family protein